MKKVLVLNGDSYVGRHVVKSFYQSQEYDVEITRTKSDARNAATAGANGQMWADAATRVGALPTTSSLDTAADILSAREAENGPCAAAAAAASRSHQQEAAQRAALPADIQPCVCGVVPKHNDDTEAFRVRLLANDVVVAVMEDDAYEATCAIRILESTHYEVEKTFVLVSSAVTWAYTLESERARARLTRQRERDEARDSFFRELLEAEEEGREDYDDESATAVAARTARRAARRRELEPRLPPSLRDPLPGEDEAEIRELVPDRVFTEEGYAARVPHPRFQHWHALEYLVKRANTQTLHTYVVFAGLPYGAGEGEAALYGLLRSAWHHQPLLQYGPGTNAIPMIHVQDLAAILFKLGNSYDTLDERYMFAVDQGRVTQRQLLQAVRATLGGSVQPARSSQHALCDVATSVKEATVAASGGPEANHAHVNTLESSLSAPSNQLAATVPGSTLGAATPAARPLRTSAFSANLTKLDRLELPPPSSPQDLFRVFGNEPCWGDGGVLLSAFVLSDIQAEPAAVLNLHPAEDWVALEGFTMSLDLVLAQFREAHEQLFRPVRALITGPPLSGADTLAVAVAQRCHAPFLPVSTVVRDYTAHVAEVRAALRALLMRRLQRRRARVQARLVRLAVQEKEARRAALAAKRRAKRDAKRARNRKRRGQDGAAAGGGDNDSGEDDLEDDDDDDEGPTAEEEDDTVDEEDLAGEDSLHSSISIFIPPKVPVASDDGEDGEEAGDEEEGLTGNGDESPSSGRHPQRAPLRPVEEVVDEAYIRGGGGGADGDEEAGMIDEEQEEGEDVNGNGEADGVTWLDQLEEQDAEKQAELLEIQDLLPEEMSDYAGEGLQPFVMPRFAARRRGRDFARDVDRQERRCIHALRREYVLGLRVLSLKVSAKDGRLPRPLPPPMSGDDDDEDGDHNRDSVKGVPHKSAEEDADEEGEDGSEEGSHEDSDGAAEDQGEEAANEGDASNSENQDEEGDNDDDDVDDDDGASLAAAAEAENVLEAARNEDASNYLDHALAFMLRWRLRQSDCRCQGYVLGNFPQTLSQAVLCFKANETELEDAELRRQRALAPLLTRLDDHESNSIDVAAEAAGGGGGGEEGDEETPLPPPLDEDFPLPDIATMEEAQLRALEKAHWRARGGSSAVAAAAADPAAAGASEVSDGEGEEATEPEPEEVMAPVDEALFVDHVVSLQANTTLLRATVEAMETNLKVTAGASPSAPSEGQQQQHATASNDEIHALNALRSLLSSSPYASQLDDYLRHHAPTVPPTQSLLAWLRAVTTTPALGARPAPVIVPLSNDAAGTDSFSKAEMSGGGGGGDAAGADGADGVTTTLEAPPTTRTAEVIAVPAPVLTVTQVKASWCVAYEAAHPPRSSSSNTVASAPAQKGEGVTLLEEGLPIALLRLAPLFWIGGAMTDSTSSLSPRQAKTRAAATAATAAAEDGKAVPLPLMELQRGLCERLAPRRRLAACAASSAAAEKESPKPLPTLPTPTTMTTPLQATPTVNDEKVLTTIAQERKKLMDLEKREVQLEDMIAREGAAQVAQERTALRKLQLAEESRDAAALLRVPAEAYLMKYVLPSLTPAMTEVVRTRADDPVTVLANVLFDYHRRTTI